MLDSSGKLYVNAASLGIRVTDPKKILGLALQTGRPVFIGIALTPAERTKTLAYLDDAFHEAVATIPTFKSKTSRT